MSSLQLHLFKCTKEEEVKNTLKKHIYFVSSDSNNVFIVFINLIAFLTDSCVSVYECVPNQIRSGVSFIQHLNVCTNIQRSYQIKCQSIL